MQDIRKPYTRSRSSEDLHARLERFHDGRRNRYEDIDIEPVRIPVKGGVSSQRDYNQASPRRFSYEENVDWQDENPYRTSSNPPRDIFRKKTSKVRVSLWVYGFAVGVVGVCAFLYSFVFNSATITVVPKYRDIESFSRIVTFSKEGNGENSVPFIIEKTSVSKSKVLTRSESRRVETKASGKITIYNDFDEEPQRLIRNTRFESEGGKIYRINEAVVVPGKKGSTPGSVEVTIYADTTGSDYNMASGKFTIPGFRGTPRYEGFYAKTSGAISGGSSGNKSLVSLADVNAAKDALALELEKELQEELQKISKDGYIPMGDAMQVLYEDNENALLNGEGEIYKVTATGYIPFAKASHLAEIIASSLVSYNKEPVRLSQVDSLRFVRKEGDSLYNATSVPILVEGSPRVVWVVDKDALKKEIVGKNTDDFKAVMKAINSIESAEMKFSPFWLSRFPNTSEKISIVEELPER